ncbi:translocation/assembly module TamB domain-containing protein [Abyssalbus ytuae]|uniref:Translocation/assembly module TamB n=1 Tax=Abyssalbus ytuae TaxID=2926907 RepID=A0A9E6ZSQ4_9FLAO|nr:translocation/assembly module TamB domain-containing protein [Abyssalbus ytuae]UOB17158.1 translocation/assembly module TamB [Abyssalbus ytuae]
MLIFILFSLPVVQTTLGKKVTNYLNKQYDTNINVKKVGLSYSGDVLLKGVYVEDYKKDTLFNISELATSILNTKKLLDGKLEFGDIDIDGLLFKLKTYKGEKDTNLDVFVAKLEGTDTIRPPDYESSFLLTSSKVEIHNSRFKLIDENKKNSNVLNYRNLNVKGKDFKINGPNVDIKVEELSFVSEQGVVIENLSTNFGYTRTGMKFENLNVKSPKSEIHGNVQFSYKRENLQDFLNKVNVKANFTNSRVALDEVNILYNEFGSGKVVTFSSRVEGVLNKLQTRNLSLSSENTSIKGDYLFYNLFESKKPFKLEANINNISSNYYQLRALLPNLLGKSLPSSIAKLGQLHLKGESVITEEFIEAELDVNTNLGYCYTDIKISNIDNIDNASYKGFVSLENFQLGKFLNDETVGKATFDFDVDGKGFTQDNLNTEIIGKVCGLEYNNYNYKDVEVSGIVKDKLFDGTLHSKDPNFMVDFKGLADFSGELNHFNFIASVDHMDLRRLNFAARDTKSIFKGDIHMDMVGNNLDNLAGEITFENTQYSNQNDIYNFRDFNITSTFEGRERILEINSPDIITGYIKGKFYYKELGDLVQNSIGSIYTNYSPHKISPDQYVEFNLKIYNKIVDVFFPELRFGKNTFIKGSMRADDGDFKLTFKSPKINAYGNLLDNISILVDNKNPLFNTFIEVDKIDAGFYNIEDFNLINVTLQDTLFFRTEFKGGKNLDEIYNLNFYHTFNEDNKSVIGLKKSELGFKGNSWVINRNNNNKNRVVFNNTLDSLNIEEVVMNNGNEQIDLKGSIIGENEKDIQLRFKDVSLNKILPEIDSLQLSGVMNGDFNIIQKGNYLPSSNVNISNFKVNNFDFGTFKLGIVGDESLTKYSVDGIIEREEKDIISLFGEVNYAGKESELDLKAYLNEVELMPFSPLGEDVISNMRGYVTGDATITGSVNNPNINGKLLLFDAGIYVPYLNIDLDFESPATVNLFNQTFDFDNIQITDRKFNTSAVLDGTITHNTFSDWYLDLNIDTRGNRFLVLDTNENDNDLYYGSGFISGNSRIYGLTDELTIDVQGTTERGTSLKIPVNDVETIADASIINFINKNEEERAFEIRKISDFKGLEMQFDLDVTPDAEVEILLDEKTGSSLKGKGYGNLLIEINTNGKFRMWGDFLTTTGEYNFKYAGVIDKRFTVLPGGSINWEGDPLSADVDIQAMYTLYANPSALLDNAPITRKIETNVIVKLSESLLQPELDYEINFPTANSIINSELQYRLEDKNKRELQALSLLSQGMFIDEVNINQQALTGNLIETASSLVNQILNNGDGKFDVGLSYEQGDRNPNLDYQTEDRLGVTVSTQVSDRILINGKIGVPVGGVTETVVAGDVEVQILLNEEGSLSARIFNRENEIQQFFAQQQGYTQGVGLSYQVDFDTFGELLRKIFGKKEQKDQTEKNDQDNKKTLGDGLIIFSEKADSGD